MYVDHIKLTPEEIDIILESLGNQSDHYKKSLSAKHVGVLEDLQNHFLDKINAAKDLEKRFKSLKGDVVFVGAEVNIIG